MTSDRKRAFRFWAEGYASMARLSETVKGSGLELSLIELIKTRVSQVNGCAYCIDMHTKDALAAGETAQRLFALSAWRETPFFTDRERAALDVAEHVTRIADGGVPESVLADASAVFSPDELTRVLYAAIEINAWNRLAITVGAPEPGSYEPG
jgi:AhpD family alkylhydroperoxidase